MALLTQAVLSALVLGSEAWQPEVKARVWRPSAEGFRYPEEELPHLAGRDDFGIGLAGGGLRGSSLAHGAVRALHAAGVLDRAKYLSVTSGSVWFGVPMYYQTKDSLEEFLGVTMPVANLTPDALLSHAAGTAATRLQWPIKKFPKGMKQEPISLQHRRLGEASELEQLELEQLERLASYPGGLMGCLENFCSCAADLLIPDHRAHELWMLVSGLLTHPYGVARKGAMHCHESQLESMRERHGNHSHILVAQDVQKKLPFLVSQSAVLSLASGLDPKTNPLHTFPLENTLMYTGVPVAFSKDAVAPEPIGGLGDLLIENFASSSMALEAVPAAAQSEVRVRRASKEVPGGDLNEWQGVTTCYLADWQIRQSQVDLATKHPCIREAGMKFMPEATMWSPLDVDEHHVPIAREMPVGDAGVYDDIGHLPLLRRGVKKMVLFDSAAVRDNSTGLGLQTNLEEMVYLKAAFGAPGHMDPPFGPNLPGAPNPLMAEGFLTVFDPKEFEPFWAKVQAQFEKGEPAVIRGNYTVVDNAHFGIKGGWQVEIVWIIALPSKSFRAALPKETAAHLPEYLPNVVSTEFQSRFELSAMSQYASWLLEERAMKEIHAMLGHKEVLV